LNHLDFIAAVIIFITVACCPIVMSALASLTQNYSDSEESNGSDHDSPSEIKSNSTVNVAIIPPQTDEPMPVETLAAPSPDKECLDQARPASGLDHENAQNDFYTQGNCKRRRRRWRL
jgi:hypothetical protein